MKNKYIVTNLVFSAMFILFLLLDRVTKKWAALTLMKGDIDLIPDILTLHYLENRGAAWGIFQNAFWLFFIITILVVGAMAYFYARIPFTRRYWYLRFTIILLSAGAIGNFIDRACWHYVVDFIYVEVINFPVFNVADCYVCIAAVLLIHSFLFYYKEEELLWKKKN